MSGQLNMHRPSQNHDKIPEIEHAILRVCQMGDLSAADTLVTLAIEKYPMEVELWRIAGDLAMRQSHWEAAVERWSALRMLLPDDLVALGEGGRAALEAGQLDKAEEFLTEAIDRETTAFWPWVDYGQVAMRRGDTNLAIKRFDEACRRFPNQPAPHERAGYARLKSGELTQGEAILNETVTRFPHYIWGRLQYAEAAMAAGKWGLAAERWATLREMFPQLDAGWFSGAVALMKGGDLSEAERLLDEGIHRFPGRTGLRIGIELAICRRDFTSASKLWHQMLESGERGIHLFSQGAKIFIHFLNEQDDRIHILWKILLTQPDSEENDYLPAIAKEAIWLSNWDLTTYKVLRDYAVAHRADLTAGTNETTLLIQLCLGLIGPGQDLTELLRRVVLSSDFTRQCALLDARLGANCVAMQEVLAYIDNKGNILTEVQYFNMAIFATTFDQSLSSRLIAKGTSSLPTPMPVSTAAGALQVIRNNSDSQLRKSNTFNILDRDRPLRVALCVSGQLRGYLEAISTWPLLGLSSYEVDTFVHSWSDVGRKFPTANHAERVFSGRFLEAYRMVFRNANPSDIARSYPSLFEWFSASSRVDELDVRSAYKTEYVILEDDSTQPYVNFNNSEKMYWKVQSCFEMIEATGRDYDIVIRIRPDKPVLHASRIDWPAVASRLRQEKTIFADLAPYMHNDVFYIIGDQFGMGHIDTMKIYSTTYSRTKEAARSQPYGFPTTFVPHRNFAFSCFYHGIRVEKMAEVIWGQPLDPPGITMDQLRALLTRDIGAVPRNAEDRILLEALAGC